MLLCVAQADPLHGGGRSAAMRVVTGEGQNPRVTATPSDEASHRSAPRSAYDRQAAVWSKTTDDGPFSGWLERPALRGLVPQPVGGKTVLDAGCGSGAQERGC